MIPPMQVVVGHSKLLVLQQTLGMLLLLALKKKAFFGLCVEEREREREFVKKKVDFHPPPLTFVVVRIQLTQSSHTIIAAQTFQRRD